MTLADTQIPLRRPHYQLRENRLYFLISRRPRIHLTAAGAELWCRLDGTTSAGDLERAAPGSLDLLAEWWQEEAIELTEADFPPNRRKVLVIEPHMDDAVLSIGGLMWQRRHSHEFHVVSLVGVSNFTSYHKIDRDFFDINAVSELRMRESHLVMRMLGGFHSTLSRHDAPLRYHPGNWSLNWFLRNKRSIAAFINQAPDEEEIRSAAAEIATLLMTTDAEEIWMPMGVGTSTDHETTRNACLLALAQTGTLRALPPVTLYQDVPYAMNFQNHTEQIIGALRLAGATIQPSHVDITDSMPAKLRLISVFASQFKMSYMAPRVEETAKLAAPADGKTGELILQMQRLPEAFDSFELYSGRDHVRNLAFRLSSWIATKHNSRRITILCPIGVGRWQKMMTSLLEHFPEANLHIHLTEDATDETKEFVSPRVIIHPVVPNGSSWLLRLLGLMLSGQRPLVIITGWRLHRYESWIRALCSPFDCLTSVSIGHLLQALELATNNHALSKHHQS